MRIKTTIAAAIVVLASVAGPAAQGLKDDESVWKAFLGWCRTTPPAPGNPIGPYGASLKASGTPAEEVTRQAGVLMRMIMSGRADWVEAFYDRTFNTSRPLTGDPPTDGFASTPSAIVVESVKGVPAGTALDGGMGQGRNAVYLATQGWKVTGFDLSGQAVKAASANAAKAGVGVDAVKASYADFDFGTARWDLIVLIFAWAPMDDEAFVAKLRTSLRPNGRIVFEHFLEDPSAPRPPAMHALKPGQLREALKGFRLDRYEELTDLADWGGPGMQVVRAVATKAGDALAPVPDLAGTWSGTTQMSRGRDLFTLVLAREGGTYAGTLSDAMRLLEKAPVLDVKQSDGTLSFAAMAALANRDLRIELSFRLDAGRLVGSWTAETGDTATLVLERTSSPTTGTETSPSVAPRAAPSPTFDRAFTEIENLVASEFARDGIGSITVGLVSGPQLVWAKSFGLADIENKVSATPDSVYRIGSITKQFTATMLLQLVEAGKVHLSEPVEKYFPEINTVQGREPWYPSPTFIQLATHTSGLDREPAGPPARYTSGPVSDWEKVLIAALPNARYAAEPDTRYLYANVGYAVLGAALGRVAGQPYVEYVKEHILAPLGMPHSGFELDADMRARLARGYEVDQGRANPAGPARELAGRGYKVPNGGLFTTVGDLARFVSFQLGEGFEAVLSKSARAENLTRTNSSMLDLSAGYGIGFTVNRRGGLVIYGHGGDTAGYSAAAQFDRSTRTGVVVLCNTSGTVLRVGPLADRVLAIMAAAAKGSS